MSNVKELQRTPDTAIVELLEDLLKDVKSGRVVGVVVLSNESGTYRRWQAGHWARQDALYLFEMWKNEVLFKGE